MSKPATSLSFLRHAAVYGLGNLLLYAAGFVLLPIYTRCLSPSEYGTLELLNRIGEVAALCLLFGSLRQAAIAFYRQSESPQEQERAIATALVLVLSVMLLGGVLLLTLTGPLGDFLGFGGGGLIRLALAAALLDGLVVVLLGIAQARLESSFLVASNVTQLLIRIFLSIALVVGLGRGVEGVLLASALTSGLFAVGLSIREWRRTPLYPDWAKLREMARFALPFLPCGLCMFVLNSGDRFLLLHWQGEQEVGIYALGYKVAAVVSTFTVTPLLMVWGPQMYDAAKSADAPQVFGRVATRILAAHLLLGLGVCLFQDEIVELLGGGRYAGAAPIVAPVVLAYWFVAVGCLADAGFYIKRQTIWKTWITLAATALVLLLYVTLIPGFGGIGAAFATIGGFGFQALLTAWVARRVFPIRFEYRWLVAMLGLAAGLWLISRRLPSENWTVSAKVVLWMLWPMLLWSFGWVTAGEKHLMRLALGLTWRQIQGLLPGSRMA